MANAVKSGGLRRFSLFRGGVDDSVFKARSEGRLALLGLACIALALLALTCSFFAGCAAPPGRPPQGAQPVQEAGSQEAAGVPSQEGLAAGIPPALPATKVLPAVVTKVVDGDTACMDVGRTVERVRFIGVDTPETKHPTVGVEPYGEEASAFTERSLAGRKVYLELDVQERDKYGRLLAYVWLEPPTSGSEDEVRSKMFNARLLLEGYAQVMTIPPNVKYADMFVKFQREAREAGKGLWGIPVAGSGTTAGEEECYVGSTRSKKFHRPDCDWAQRISPDNRVEFKSREEAIEAGYEPCKACRP